MRCLAARDVVALAATAREMREVVLGNEPGWRDLVVRDFGAHAAAVADDSRHDNHDSDDDDVGRGRCRSWVDVYRELSSTCAVVVDLSRPPASPSFAVVPRAAAAAGVARDLPTPPPPPPLLPPRPTRPGVVPRAHSGSGLSPNTHYGRSVRFLAPGQSFYSVHVDLARDLVHGGLVVRALHLASTTQGQGHAPVRVTWDGVPVAGGDPCRPPLDNYGEGRFTVPRTACVAGAHVLRIALSADAWTHYWLSGIVLQSECDDPARELPFVALLGSFRDP